MGHVSKKDFLWMVWKIKSLWEDLVDTEPYRHEAWQAKVPPSRCVQSQAGSWLRELDAGGRELLVPDLQRTDCALYRVSLPGSPAQFDTDWGA